MMKRRKQTSPDSPDGGCELRAISRLDTKSWTGTASLARARAGAGMWPLGDTKACNLLLNGAYDRKDEIAEPYLPQDATSRRIKRVVAVPITIIIYESTAKQNQQQRRCLN